jgi:outer membrane protein assembly factor BamB
MPARFGRYPVIPLSLGPLLGLLFAVWILAARPGQPIHRRDQQVAAPAPPATARWRSMRLLWRREVGRSDIIGARVADMQTVGGRLYYVGQSEVGCVAVQTGRILWKRPLAPSSGEQQTHLSERVWNLAASDRIVVVSESHRYEPPSPPPYRLLAFDATTGKPLWQKALQQEPYGCPCLGAGRVIAGTRAEGVIALEESDGRIAWPNPGMALGWTGESSSPSVLLRGEGPLAVAQLGGNELVGFRIRDGRALWQTRARDPVDGGGDSEGFAVRGGVAYTRLGGSEFVAIQIATGRRLWTRISSDRGTPSSAPEVLGNRVIAEPWGILAALDCRTGRTAWSRGADDAGQILHDTATAPEAALLLKTSTPPRITDRPTRTLSVPSLDTLIALDPRTGREEWRWQPYEGIEIRQVLEAGKRLLITDGSELFCAVEGRPDPLPRGEAARRRLAGRVVKPLLELDAPHSSPDGVSWFPLSESEKNEARLQLLRLGRDSVPALLDRARTDLESEESRIPAPGELRSRREYRYPREHGSALDLLVDIGEPGAVPELVRMAERLKNPLSVDRLAEALLRFGDPRAAPLLFRYARSGNPMLQLDALYFACRVGAGSGLDQREVTAYLLVQIRNLTAPRWLRRFAQFELLNERGEQAQATALAAFGQEKTTRLLPGSDEDVGRGPDGPFGRFDFDGKPAVRDAQGTWWTAAFCRYLDPGGTHLWVAQSRDCRKWTRPAFAQDLSAVFRTGGPTKLRLRRSDLVVDLEGMVWRGQKEVPVRRQVVLPLADLYRDTDGDGLPDRLERQIGTDPDKADTNGDGIPDGSDKNPTYRPHPLTDEEGIYQAVVEALCQLSRSASPGQTGDEASDAAPAFLGRSHEPLLLPLPPGSGGIEILGHPGPVLYLPRRSTSGMLPSRAMGQVEFTPPSIRLDGTWQQEPVRRRLWEYSPRDPFEPESGTIPFREISFREFFPYELSADGSRARVGWEEVFQGIRPVGSGFDVEVRKMGGRWLPVECRQVYNIWGLRRDEVVTPVRPVRLRSSG